MFVEAILVSVVIGLIRGGSIRRLKTLNHRNVWIMVTGILVQYLLIFLSRLEGIGMVDNIMSFSREIQLLSYAMILVGIILNIKQRSLWLILGGYAMNFMVLFRNAWKMPVLSEAIHLTSTVLHTPIVQGTKLSVLGKIIVFADPYPLVKVISMGDLLIGLGVILLIQEVMLGKYTFRKKRIF